MKPDTSPLKKKRKGEQSSRKLMATLIMKTKKTFHLRQELQLVCNRREFSLLAIPPFSPLYLQCTISAFSSAHPQPFVWYLIAESGAGERRWGQGGTRVDARFDNSALSGAGLPAASHMKSQFHLCKPPADPTRQRFSSHSAQMSSDCGVWIQAPRF